MWHVLQYMCLSVHTQSYTHVYFYISLKHKGHMQIPNQGPGLWISLFCMYNSVSELGVLFTVTPVCCSLHWGEGGHNRHVVSVKVCAPGEQAMTTEWTENQSVQHLSSTRLYFTLIKLCTVVKLSNLVQYFCNVFIFSEFYQPSSHSQPLQDQSWVLLRPLFILPCLALPPVMCQCSVTWPVAWQWTDTLKPCVCMCVC